MFQTLGPDPGESPTLHGRFRVILQQTLGLVLGQPPTSQSRFSAIAPQALELIPGEPLATLRCRFSVINPQTLDLVLSWPSAIEPIGSKVPSPHVVSLSWLLLQLLGLYYVLYVLFYHACKAYVPEELSLYSWTCIMYHTYYTVLLYYMYSTYKYHVLRNPLCGRSAKHSIFMRPLSPASPPLYRAGFACDCSRH